jgi:aryl-alcohol dehydrogenase-like predicted oxidoreductase
MLAEGPIPGEPDDRILLAMGFTFAHPEVDVAIVGTQRPEHMQSNIELVSNQLPINAEVVAALHDRYDRVADGWEQRG